MNQQDLACFPSDNFLCILISVPRMRTELIEKKKKRFLLPAKVEHICEGHEHAFPENSLSFALNGNYNLYIRNKYIENNYAIFLSYQLVGKKKMLCFSSSGK